MTTHILALTYLPKIEAVRSGLCCQTIRRYNPMRPKRPGDKLILHTWAGRPYRSKWDWRLETTISSAYLMEFPPSESDEPVMLLAGEGCTWTPLDDFDLMHIASMDCIERPSADSLCQTLRELNNMQTLADTEWEIIRWKPEARA